MMGNLASIRRPMPEAGASPIGPVPNNRGMLMQKLLGAIQTSRGTAGPPPTNAPLGTMGPPIYSTPPSADVPHKAMPELANPGMISNLVSGGGGGYAAPSPMPRPMPAPQTGIGTQPSRVPRAQRRNKAFQAPQPSKMSMY